MRLNFENCFSEAHLILDVKTTKSLKLQNYKIKLKLQNYKIQTTKVLLRKLLMEHLLREH